MSNQNKNQNIPQEIEKKEVNKMQEIPAHIIDQLEKTGITYEEYIIARYLSIPRSLREQNIEQFCIENNILRSNFYVKADKPVVIKARRILTKAWFSRDIPDVLIALKHKALTGDVFAVKTFLQYVDDWNAMTEEDDRTDKKIYVREQINIVIQNLKAKGLTKEDKIIDV